MEGLRNPVGDLPPEVYWRRRIIVLAGFVLVVILLWMLINAPGKKSDDVNSTKSPQITKSGPTSSPNASASNQISASACKVGDLEVSVAPANFEFSASEVPVFNVTVKNKSAAACTLDSAKDSSLKITSGNDEVFLSSHCAAESPIPAKELLLQPDAQELLQVSWNKKRSVENCGTGSDMGAGYYWIELGVQGASAERVQFRLT